MNLTLRDLLHRYVGTEADAPPVLDVPLWQLNGGDQILLRGVSGSGKTTLFNIIAGLLRPSAGEVLYDDVLIYALAEAQRDKARARAVGYVFQTHHLLPNLTVLENVIIPQAFAGVQPRSAWAKTAAAALDAVGITPNLHTRRPAHLSTGQRQRVAIARALVNQPRLVLADEPTASLDAATAHVALDHMQSACGEMDAVLLVASHDPAVEARFSTVYDLAGGRLEEKHYKPRVENHAALSARPELA